MDHETAIREKLTERYLLRELDPRQRDEFEEHLFDCTECAYDVRAGSEFITYSKGILSESARVQEKVRTKLTRDWASWLRPVYSITALIVVLAGIVAYQNLVTYPALRAGRQPKVLPWASVVIGTWGANAPAISVAPRQSFLLFLRIPPDENSAKYTGDLYDPEGSRKYSFTISAATGQDTWPVLIPGGNWRAGKYRVVVRGLSATGDSKDLGSTSFELQTQK